MVNDDIKKVLDALEAGDNVVEKNELGKGFEDDLFSSNTEDKPARKKRMKKPKRGKTFYWEEDLCNVIEKIADERGVSDSIVAGELVKESLKRSGIDY